MKKIILRFGIPFVTLCFSLSVILAPFSSASAAVSDPDWIKGADMVPQSSTDYGSASTRQSLSNLRATGATYVNFVIPFYQSNGGSTDVSAGSLTPTDAALVSAITYAHSIGLKVALIPHMYVYDNTNPFYINPGDRNAWFKAYGNLLSHYASIASANGVEMIIIGNELADMTEPQVNPTNTSNWQSLISSLRQQYNGKLSYDSNFGGSDFLDETDRVGFWSSLDYIGISAYYTLPADGSDSVSSLESSWAAVDSASIKPLYNTYHKPILFTEVGYRSAAGAHNYPWNYYANDPYSATEQANDYAALYGYWNNSSYMLGVFLWYWSTNPNAGGQGNTDYTPQNKPAQDVMKQWFGPVAVATSSTSTASSTAASSSSPTSPSSPQSLSYSASVSNTPATAPLPNQNVNFTVNVKNTSATSSLNNGIVDVEIYSSSKKQVNQKVFSGQSLASGMTSAYPISWTPTASDAYTISVGIFSSDWSTLYSWINSFAMISTMPQNVSTQGGSQGGTQSTGSQQTGTGAQGTTQTGTTSITSAATSTMATSSPVISTSATTSSSVVTTSTSTSTSSAGSGAGSTSTSTSAGSSGSIASQAPAKLDVWWPVSGATVSGVQPFKSMLENANASTYNGYWQVDGGQPVLMTDNSTDYPHKEFDVDLSSWTWKGNGPYSLTFTAKDKQSSQVLDTKSFNIYVVK